MIDENPSTASHIFAKVSTDFALGMVEPWVRMLDGENVLASFGVPNDSYGDETPVADVVDGPTPRVTGVVLFTDRRVIFAFGLLEIDPVTARFLWRLDPEDLVQVRYISYKSVSHWRFGHHEQPSHLVMFSRDVILLDVRFESDVAGEVQDLLQEHIAH